MLIASSSGNGFGNLGAFQIGTQFKCLKACYGIGTDPASGKKIHDIFLELQQEANLIATLFNLRRTLEDHFIGTDTVRLLNEIAQRSSIGAFARAPFTKETTSAQAVELIQSLSQIQMQAPPPIPGVTPRVIPPITLPPTVVTAPPTPKVTRKVTEVFEPAPPGPKPRTKLIIGVIAGAAILGTIITVAAVRSRRSDRHERQRR